MRTELIGKILADKYRIDELIGSGGMANVYKAVQITTSRPVAVKVLKEEYSHDAEFLRRFQREAQAVLTLSHENIVHSFDVGEDQGYHFIVLEYVEGRTLKDMIREDGPMDAKRAIHLAAQILDALTNAHARGIIHRDVKPQNVIVTAKDKANLADFGIARNADATVTFAGPNVLGSVHYISPEQAQGENVTAASDVYSMGIVLYEMVTGEVPFNGENSVSIALKHLQEDVAAPNTIRPDIPRALNDVIVKATRKDPSERYESAKQMRHDLLRALREPQGTFVQLFETTKKKKERQKLPRSRRVVVRIAIVVAVALIFALAVFLIGRMAIENMRAEAGTEYIPKLTEKSVEEAEATARLRGYEVDVVEWESDPDVPAGIVLRQEPSAGSLAAPGSSIKLTISTGGDTPLVPDLAGKTLAEATEMLHAEGLNIGSVEYQLSSEPAGTVIRQDPAFGTQMVLGDEVNVFLSGEPDRSVAMPKVTEKNIADALRILSERGLKNIWLRTETPSGAKESASGEVAFQSPATDERVQPDSLIELTVFSNATQMFAADVAINVDIEKSDTPVAVTVVSDECGVEYERVLYETVLAAGKQQPISFTAQHQFPGEKELILYVDGKETRRVKVTFTYRA